MNREILELTVIQRSEHKKTIPKHSTNFQLQASIEEEVYLLRAFSKMTAGTLLGFGKIMS
jgi:hypothetical protein